MNYFDRRGANNKSLRRSWATSERIAGNQCQFIFWCRRKQTYILWLHDANCIHHVISFVKLAAAVLKPFDLDGISGTYTLKLPEPTRAMSSQYQIPWLTQVRSAHQARRAHRQRPRSPT